jgi:hypothetical protein
MILAGTFAGIATNRSTPNQHYHPGKPKSGLLGGLRVQHAERQLAALVSSKSQKSGPQDYTVRRTRQHMRCERRVEERKKDESDSGTPVRRSGGDEAGGDS